MGRPSTVAEKPPVADPLVDLPPTPKKRTGRKSNAQKAIEDIDAQRLKRQQWEAAADNLSPMLQPVFGTVFDIIARRRGAHWALKSEEVKQLSRAAAIVLEKRLPSFWIEWQEEIILALLLGGCIGGRIGLDAKVAKERKAKKVQVDEQRPSDNGHSQERQDDIATALAPATA